MIDVREDTDIANSVLSKQTEESVSLKQSCTVAGSPQESPHEQCNAFPCTWWFCS